MNEKHERNRKHLDDVSSWPQADTLSSPCQNQFPINLIESWKSRTFVYFAVYT